jgi:hypothetical protein
MSDLTKRVMADPSTHYWVKEQYIAALERDPVDALNNAKLLAAMLQDRLDAIKAGFAQV